jgi:hypothetical protein
MAAKNKANKGGALSTNPSAKTPAANKPADGLKRVSPGIYRNPQGQLVNSSGKRIDSRGRPVKTAPEKPAQQNKPVGTPNAPAGSVEEKFRNLSQDRQAQEMGTDYGAYLNQAFAQEQARLAAGQPDFSGQLESARQNVMGQFERTMGPEFQRQQMELRQRMAEQGIDPNSGAYQAQMKMLNDSQNNARQNAMTQAFTQGAEYQQQGFTQDVTGRLLPFQIGQLGSEPWKLGFAARTEAEQKEKDRQAAIQQARISGGATIGAARENAAAARDVAAADNMNRYNPVKKPNPLNSAIQGVATGGSAAATNHFLR